MPKQKRDYEKLKKEFMASKFTEVKQFIEDKGARYNATRSKNTKGWAKEKRELKARAADKAIKKVETKLAEKLEPSAEFLLGNINKAIELTAMKLDQMEEKGNINVKDLNTIWSMNRIQNGQPTTYVKEENETTTNIKLEGIHIFMGPNNVSKGENNVDGKV